MNTIRKTTLDRDACLPLLGDMSCFLGGRSRIEISDHIVEGITTYVYVSFYWDYEDILEMGGVSKILDRVVKFFKPHDTLRKPSFQHVEVLPHENFVVFEQMYEIVRSDDEQDTK